MSQGFEKFPKIPRLSRDIVITEKLDGTNAQVCITSRVVYEEVMRHEYPPPVAWTAQSDWGVWVGSRKRWITPKEDNFGFARWVMEHLDEVAQLGAGRHYGEWWGQGINRGYGLPEKRFSLFNTHRWTEDNTPECINVVPILYTGPFDTVYIEREMELLREYGSIASPGFRNPEGIVIFHTQGNLLFKKTILNDGIPKSFCQICGNHPSHHRQGCPEVYEQLKGV